ncbi:MAG TPA: tRNA (cytidine(34)-2'-O)-methyltransferase [Kiritimatiellia bacterium]|nr:tRNA (cytidine(34)-2'-O)-methyltransferase [Kiritimatiellia bacterium]HPR68538.1 tRNA (cytidine(34)-2'-O)-methyltransferase [Kiritimatiellia bacterium]
MKHPHARKADFDFRWPDVPLHVVLVHPEIPPNTGNIARLCAATGSRLHLVEPLGFSLSAPRLRRAGLDYWDALDIRVHAHWNACLRSIGPTRFYLFSTGSARLYSRPAYQPGDTLVFGSETRGLPDDLLAAHPEAVHGIPILTNHVRSLNLSSAVAIVVYEALRQLDIRTPAAPKN